MEGNASYRVVRKLEVVRLKLISGVRKSGGERLYSLNLDSRTLRNLTVWRGGGLLLKIWFAKNLLGLSWQIECKLKRSPGDKN